MRWVTWILEYSYILGPLLLLAGGWLVKCLQNSDPIFRPDNFFFGMELSLTGIGSLLGAIVNLTGAIDVVRVLVLMFLLFATIFALAIVMLFHRAFHDDQVRKRLRFLVLGGLCNFVPLVTLMATLYFSKIPVQLAG